VLTATITSPWRWPSVKFQDGLVTPIRSDVYPGLPGQFSSLTSAGAADIKSLRGLPGNFGLTGARRMVERPKSDHNWHSSEEKLTPPVRICGGGEDT